MLLKVKKRKSKVQKMHFEKVSPKIGKAIYGYYAIKRLHPKKRW